MSFDKKAYQREYMRKKRASEYAAGQPKGIGAEKGEDGRYPDRKYNEDGSLVLFEQRCPLEGCKGVWSASIEIPCPYCKGAGVRRVTNRN